MAPVFLLFLDCVYQIHTQFPCSFEFSPGLLVVLADHSCSSNFGTFLWDCEKERRDGRVREQTVSLWSFLNQVEILSQHLNCLYLPQPTVIWPSVAPMSLGLWSGYFLRWVQVGLWLKKLMEVQYHLHHRPQFLQLGVKKGGGWERSWRETKLLKELLPS